MRDKIYIYRSLRNVIILSLLYPVFEVVVEYTSTRAITFGWIADQFPWLLIPPVVLGFIMPFLMPYKILELRPENEAGILQLIDSVLADINYKFKKKKGNIRIYRFRSGFARYFYMYFDRIYIREENGNYRIHALASTIEQLESLLSERKRIEKTNIL